MNGIDISANQGTINVSNLDVDFVIVKATQGTYYKNPNFTTNFQQGLSSNKCMGIYHYAGGGAPSSEAAYFLSVAKPYIGKAILCLDWEQTQNTSYGINDANWCTQFMDYVYQQTGVKCFLYISASLMTKFKTVLNNYHSWIAQYPDYNKVNGFIENPWNEGAYSCDIRQYTSQLYISGYSKNLDGNKSYITKEQWNQYAKATTASTTTATTTSSTTSSTTSTTSKTIAEIAQEVLNGKWGNGAVRKTKLEAAGYNYTEIQNAVNALMAGKTASSSTATTTTTVSTAALKTVEEVAREVLVGKWGNGTARKKNLEAAGYNYTEIQKKVNQLLG